MFLQCVEFALVFKGIIKLRSASIWQEQVY